MKTPLHTRIYATMAAALVAGVLAWGGPPPVKRRDNDASLPGAQAQTATATPTATATATATATSTSTSTSTSTPTPVPLQVRIRRVPADPDGIGPCPKRHSPVIWQGLSEDGRPTWKHQDGSITQRARQTIRTEGGEVLEVPVILSMRPATVGDIRGASAPTPGGRRSDG